MCKRDTTVSTVFSRHEIKLAYVTRFCSGKRDGLMVSALDSGSRFEPWPGSLHCVLGQDTLFSQCLSPPRCSCMYK